MEQRVTDPTPDDLQDLARRFLVVDALVREHLGRPLARDTTDLTALQELLDLGVLGPDRTIELQCLGIVFGMILADAVEGMDWAIVEDEIGRDPALRFAGTSLLVFPMTMLSKRVEEGEEVRVVELFGRICVSLEELKRQAE
jgi:hypothetical protein